MTTYAKPTVIPAWAENAANPADIITMANTDVATGWPLSGTPPSRQRFNFLINWASAGVRYFMQRGLPDYDATETYAVGGCVIGNDGGTYRSLVANNVGNTPSTSPASWTPWALTLVQINASQLTQATQGTGDASSKVASTSFVANAITQVSSVLTTAYTAAITAAVNALNASIAAVNGTAVNAQNTANAANTAASTAQGSANSALTQIGTLNGKFGSTLSANGAQSTPGATFRWGSGINQATGNNVTQELTFSPAFPNNCFQVILGNSSSNPADGRPQSYVVVEGTVTRFGCLVQQLRGDDQGSITTAPIFFAIGD